MLTPKAEDFCAVGKPGSGSKTKYRAVARSQYLDCRSAQCRPSGSTEISYEDPLGGAEPAAPRPLKRRYAVLIRVEVARDETEHSPPCPGSNYDTSESFTVYYPAVTIAFDPTGNPPPSYTAQANAHGRMTGVIFHDSKLISTSGSGCATAPCHYVYRYDYATTLQLTGTPMEFPTKEGKKYYDLRFVSTLTRASEGDDRPPDNCFGSPGGSGAFGRGLQSFGSVGDENVDWHIWLAKKQPYPSFTTPLRELTTHKPFSFYFGEPKPCPPIQGATVHCSGSIRVTFTPK
jgi:hypothetical protein